MSDKIKEYTPVSAPAKPDPAAFNHPVAYRIAFILWHRGGSLASMFTPEEFHWLKAVPATIENLQKRLLDIAMRTPTPGLSESPTPSPVSPPPSL